jgi:primosomal protein N'
LPGLGVHQAFLLTKNNDLLADQIASGNWEKIVIDDLKQRKFEGMPPFTRYFEIEASEKQLEQIQELNPGQFIQKDKNVYAAFLPHNQILKIQDLFAAKPLKMKVRLDSPDFS